MSEEASLRILYLEDNPMDEELTKSVLEEQLLPHEIVCADTKNEFLELLNQREWNVILADYTLPAFDGMSALKLVREKDPDMPFILISGTIGEELAAEALKSGATDFVLKGNLAYRLVPVLKRALRDSQEKREHRQLEEEFRQAQKMEAIGRLAGGVAHDFNNLLTIILGCSQLALRKLPSENPLHRDLSQIHLAGEKAAILVKQLLSFSRKQVLQPEVLNLNQIITGIEKMLKRVIGEDLILELILAEGVPSIKLDRSQLEQVVLNLAINARDAMPEGGKLAFRTSYVSGSKADNVFGIPPGDYAHLEVIDTGSGMTDEVMSRIFEPFFTTKDKDKGTGLGLATVASIMKQSNGHVSVESQVGRGSNFHLYFPAFHEAAAPAAHPAAVEELPGGSETILVVDDEKEVAEFAARLLREGGYKVMTAYGAKEADMLTARLDGSHPHLLITDVIMPEMNGFDLAKRLAERFPALKVIYTSGYTHDFLAQTAGHQDIVYIQKPYMPQGLLVKVREVLDRPLREQEDLRR